MIDIVFKGNTLDVSTIALGVQLYVPVAVAFNVMVNELVVKAGIESEV